MYGESLIHSFLPLGVISSVKSPNKKKNYCPENEMCVCVCGRCPFLPYLF